MSDSEIEGSIDSVGIGFDDLIEDVIVDDFDDFIELLMVDVFVDSKSWENESFTECLVDSVSSGIESSWIESLISELADFVKDWVTESVIDSAIGFSTFETVSIDDETVFELADLTFSV